MKQSARRFAIFVLVLIFVLSAGVTITVMARPRGTIDSITIQVPTISGLDVTMTNVYDHYAEHYRQNTFFMFEPSGTISFNQDVTLNFPLYMNAVELRAGEVFRFDGFFDPGHVSQHVGITVNNTNISFYTHYHFANLNEMIEFNEWNQQGWRWIPLSPHSGQPPAQTPPPSGSFVAGEDINARISFSSNPVSTREEPAWGTIHTFNVGTTAYIELKPNIHQSGLVNEYTMGMFQMTLIDGSTTMFRSEHYADWNMTSANLGSIVLNTPGRFSLEPFLTFYVVGEATAPPQTTQPTPPPTNNNSVPNFTAPPSSTDNGVWMEFTTVPNNRFGYRIFRATSATDDGISTKDFPIMINSAHSLDRIITFDPNVRPNGDYWYYIREVIEEASFDIATTTLTPEVLGPASARVHVRASASTPEWTNERGFIMMFIDNPQMNVNNVWEGIDPPRNITAPVINAGRTMVPIRAIVKAKSGTANWDAVSRRIDLRSHGNHVQMWLDQSNTMVNGTTREMDVIPQIVNDRTLIPLRFVAEFLGSQVEWIGSQQMVVIVYELQ